MFQAASETESASERDGRVRRLYILVILAGCFCLANSTVLAQDVTRSTGGINTAKTNPSPNRPDAGSRRRPPRGPRRPEVLRGSASEESDNFLDLGDRFAEKSRWNAAEAAFQEAVRLWSGNSDAWVAMGYLYVDKGTLTDAYRVYNRLRALDSKLAEDLLTEIKKK